ncbi:hypothetical protein ACT3TY_09730 [Halomonas sp. AOP22-C1-8]|uniref:hypothetical protein n=1 Tax=Halomonas sp. AOP22-C1-8 TaxID=3457717 RepID=UPI0040332C35
MKNDKLSNLILSIKLQVKDDVQAGATTTRYKLPEAALADDVIEALDAHFKHYKSCSIDDGILVLVHPDPED